MNGRLWGGRRADAFQQALGGQVDLTEYELAEFVRLAHTLSEMPLATLGDEARSTMRERLVAEAETVLGADPVLGPAVRRRPRRRKLRIAVGSTAAAAAISAGLVSMSADALPGDVLYPIKRGVEQVELTVGGGGAAATGQTRLDHAAERLQEAEQLARGGNADEVGAVLDDFTSDAEVGTEQLLRAYASDGDTARIEQVRAFANNSAGRLRALAPMLGRSSGTSYETAVETVTSIDRRAVAACPECAGGPTVQIPYDPEHINALPDDDRGNTGAQHDSDADVVANPDELPHGTDIPPIEHPDQGGTDEHDGGNTDSGDEPTLTGDTSSGSDSSDYVRPDNDDSTDHALPNLPDLPDLPEVDENTGSIVGSLPLGPVDEVLAPVQDLIDQLGPIGDLLAPVIGNGEQSDKDQDRPKGPLDDLLGPVIGKDKAEADDKQQPRDENKPDADLDPVHEEGTDEEDGPADDLIDGVDDSTDAPPVEQDDLDPLEDGATDGTLGGD